MIVIVKSGPDATDGQRGLSFARDASADLVLIQNGVSFAQKERLGPFTGSISVLDDDKRLRGLGDSELDERAVSISYDTLTDILTSGEKVIGMF